MKKIIFPLAISATLFLSAFAMVVSHNYKIADGYSIKFTSENPEGVFTSLKGDILFDEKNLEASKFSVIVDAASINTGNGLKNKHAKSEKWFDVEKYPSIKFTSSKISKTANGYEATGILDMHGVQKELTMPFTFQNNTFKSTFNISRVDYKIGSTEGMSANAATILKVDISVPVTN